MTGTAGLQQEVEALKAEVETHRLKITKVLTRLETLERELGRLCQRQDVVGFGFSVGLAKIDPIPEVRS